jgi:hypothetical protein
VKQKVELRLYRQQMTRKQQTAVLVAEATKRTGLFGSLVAPALHQRGRHDKEGTIQQASAESVVQGESKVTKPVSCCVLIRELACRTARTGNISPIGEAARLPYGLL